MATFVTTGCLKEIRIALIEVSNIAERSCCIFDMGVLTVAVHWRCRHHDAEQIYRMQVSGEAVLQVLNQTWFLLILRLHFFISDQMHQSLADRSQA